MTLQPKIRELTGLEMDLVGGGHPMYACIVECDSEGRCVAHSCREIEHQHA